MKRSNTTCGSCRSADRGRIWARSSTSTRPPGIVVGMSKCSSPRTKATLRCIGKPSACWWRSKAALCLGQPEPSSAWKTETRGQIAPGVPDLLGRVDLLVDTGDALVVTDFKSSRSRWNADHVEAAADQLLLYGQLVRDMAQGRRLELQFCVITKTKDPSVECHAVEWSPSRSARSTRVVERVWSAIASSHFYPAPSALNCGSCPFREAVPRLGRLTPVSSPRSTWPDSGCPRAANQPEREVHLMDSVLVLALLGAAVWCIYKSGKRIGSRKGYHVGRSRSRRRR